MTPIHRNGCKITQKNTNLLDEELSLCLMDYLKQLYLIHSIKRESAFELYSVHVSLNSIQSYN